MSNNKNISSNDSLTSQGVLSTGNVATIDDETHIGTSDDIPADYPAVILDNGTYKMWYTGNNGSDWRIHYATSTDGISWVKHGAVVPLGADGDSDNVYTDASDVILDNGTYKMWYSGYDGTNWRIHYATSSDGVHWTKHGVVVVPPGASGDSDDIHAYYPTVILDNGTYKMWYGGYDGSNTRIHYATSTDGVTWTKHGVVVSPGASGDSDDIHVYYPTVILDNGTYKMWHGGYDGSNARIHYATSTDGISWVKHGAVVPLGADGDSDNVYTDASDVILDNGTYKMWYSGYDGTNWRIHYATSSDGVHWTKHGVVVPLGADGDSDGIHAYYPTVILDNGTYKMWYGGYDGSNTRIHYATSTDGVTWTKHGVVVSPGASGDSDGIHAYYPTVILDNGTYKMWHGGYDGSNARIHYATSTDGISWVKHGVVVPLGASGDSDDIHTHTPIVILDNGTYKMWYSGCDGTNWRIHYATSTDGISWVKHGAVVSPATPGNSGAIHKEK